MSGVNARMRSVFFRSLATMFGSGVSLDSALYMLSQQQEHPALATACTEMAIKLRQGNYLSQAMQSHPAMFLPVHQKMVMSGERSGQLHAVLFRLADREEHLSSTAHKLKSMLAMPLIVSGLCLSLAVAAPPVLLRGLFSMLVETGATLPWTTRMLMSFSAWVTSPLFFLFLLAAGVAFRQARKRLAVDAQWQFQLLKVPYLGESLRLAYVTHFLQNLRTMLEVGIPLLQALEFSARATDVVHLEEVVKGVRQRLIEGEELSDALLEADYFPTSLIGGIRASEEAGRLPQMLQNLETIYRLDLDQRLEMLGRALEPLVLGLIGLSVGFTLVATLQPLLSVLDKL